MHDENLKDRLLNEISLKIEDAKSLAEKRQQRHEMMLHMANEDMLEHVLTHFERVRKRGKIMKLLEDSLEQDLLNSDPLELPPQAKAQIYAALSKIAVDDKKSTLDFMKVERQGREESSISDSSSPLLIQSTEDDLDLTKEEIASMRKKLEFIEKLKDMEKGGD